MLKWILKKYGVRMLGLDPSDLGQSPIADNINTIMTF